MKVLQVKNFPISQYFPQAHKKKWIALHHTVGSTADGAISWWKSQPEKVGTAYVIDKDGSVSKVFNDTYFAYQFGLSGVPRRVEFEQGTIGIELVNEGPIIKTGNTFTTSYYAAYKSDVTESNWRGYKYWANYTDAQYLALSELLKNLSIAHNIELKIKADLEFNLNVFNTHTVLNHAQVRLDKTDLSPAFDFNKLQKLLG